MNKHVDDAINLIDQNFPADWWQSYSFDKSEQDAPDLDHEIKRFINLTNELEDKVFDILNISILRGEYVESNDFIEKLLTLKDRIKNIRPDQEGYFPEDSINALLLSPAGALISGFIEPLKLAINYYHQFLLLIHNKLSI